MNIYTISYLVADAFHTMKKDIKNELISFGTMLATMVFVAVAYIVYINAQVIIENNRSESSNILAFLEIGLTDEEMQKVGFEIEKIPGVSNGNDIAVEFHTVEESIKRAETMSKALLAGYTDEEKAQLIPAYYVVHFDDVKAVPGIISSIKKIDGVGKTEDDVLLDDNAAEAEKNAKKAKTIAFTAMIYVIELSFFLMMNTTKLMVYTKRKEISIMKYVGAKDNFIKAPFAIQGVVTSLVAVAMTLLLVYIIYPIATASMDRGYLAFSDMFGELLFILLVLGCSIGAIGSMVSMNKYLDV